MYIVFKVLENGEFLRVVSLEELEQAVQIAQRLNTHWPGKYVVKDSKGTVVHPPTDPPM
jgi:hypothetical protein